MKLIISVFIIPILWSCNAQKPVPGKINEVGLVTNNKELEFTVEYMMGKFDPASHPDFISIPSKYRDEEIRYIRKDVLEAFIKMYDAAAADGIRIIIRSATRILIIKNAFGKINGPAKPYWKAMSMRIQLLKMRLKEQEKFSNTVLCLDLHAITGGQIWTLIV